MKTHPCLTCGACCTLPLRASFPWQETLPDSYNVPIELTEQVSPHLVAMKKDSNCRCVALVGEIGNQSECTIYSNRSSTCREFMASFENGIKNDKCDEMRARHNLPQLSMADFIF
ncbi:MAG: YkgJ family cysteine cluster protein [Bacteriovoracaceae bacterium]